MSYGNIKAETAWEKMRIGKPTASKIGVLFSANERKRTDGKIDKKLSVGAKTYLREKVGEYLTGHARQISVFSTQWGETWEPTAIERLKVFYPNIIHYGGNDKQFFKYKDFEAGGSPDAENLGISKNDSISFEIKCPENFENHIDYSLMKSADEMDKEYYYQLQFNMLILAERAGVTFENVRGEFVSFCPLILREEKQLFRLPVKPDLNFQEMIDDKLIMAQDYIIEVLDKFSSKQSLTLS